MIGWGRLRKTRPPVEVESAFERRTLPGIPSVFTGKDATLGEQRLMAKMIVDDPYVSAVARGLAISLLAVIDLFEREVEEKEETE